MTKEFIFAGFGGQGMLLIGKFMAMACMLDGKHVSWLPSYGPEMRGGTANCSVIVSDEDVASPLVDKADCIVAMNLPSLDKFEDHVKPGGTLVINSSIIDRKAERDDIQVVYCDANRIAEAVNNNANIIKTKKAIKKAFQYQMEGKGFCMIEVLSACPTNWGLSPIESVKWLEENMIPYYPLGVYKDKEAK